MKAKSVLIGLCLFGLLTTGWSQNSTNAVTPGIPGVLDPQTGFFKPMPLVPAVDIDPTAVPATVGKIVLTLSATLTTSFPATESFSCGMNATVSDVTSGLLFFDTISIAATKVGSTLKCTVTLPYSWDLTNAALDTMEVSYTINAINGTGNPIRIAQHGVANVHGVPSGTTSYTRSTVI
jgi:hypothetical protein